MDPVVGGRAPPSARRTTEGRHPSAAHFPRQDTGNIAGAAGQCPDNENSSLREGFRTSTRDGPQGPALEARFSGQPFAREQNAGEQRRRRLVPPFALLFQRLAAEPQGRLTARGSFLERAVRRGRLWGSHRRSSARSRFTSRRAFRAQDAPLEPGGAGIEETPLYLNTTTTTTTAHRLRGHVGA